MPIRYCFQKPLKEIITIIYKLKYFNSVDFSFVVVVVMLTLELTSKKCLLDAMYKEIKSGL